jgi:tripartite-type tricarboxylate transporter receptor subunit TctC
MQLTGRNRHAACAMAFAMSGAMAPHAAAQSYPMKPIRMVCPSSPGGTTDYVARLVAQKLTEAWGQQIVVDDRPGAGGIVGTEMVAKAPPDGYTLLLGTITTHAVNPALHAGLKFDAIKDFAPISLVVSSPQLLAVHPSVPARTVKEFIAVAKARSGQFNYGSAGIGNSSHLVFELFKNMTGIDITHVSYKGSGPAISALVGGEVQAIITGIVALYPQVKAGRLRGIAVTSLHRAAALPDLPTISEAGVPGFDVTSWFGVFAPAGTSNAIVMKLNAGIREMLDMPEVRQRLINQGADPASNTPEQFAAFIKSEKARWSKVVKDAGVRPE